VRARCQGSVAVGRNGVVAVGRNGVAGAAAAGRGMIAPLTPMRIGLVGCSKSKRERAAPAHDLYDRSTLFRGARCFVEQRCER
jgi:hypothetical protein